MASWDRLLRFVLLPLVLSAVDGCAEDDLSAPAMTYIEPEPLVVGEAQQRRLCGRGRSDVVLDVFCRREPPVITGLADLRETLDLDDPALPFAMNAHSTALPSRAVSAINPRIFFIREPKPGVELLILAYVRGEPLAEMVTRDRVTGELQFYVFKFERACGEDCTPGDELTEVAESGWERYDVYAEEDLANSPIDCRVCHQPYGPDTAKILRMQELEPPWNHWFYNAAMSGRAVFDDYYAAKGDETFAGYVGDEVEASQPGVLAAAVYFANPYPQPNLFVSAKIEREVNASAAARGGNQPKDNAVPGESETWNKIYERAKRGEVISVPYHDVKVTDANKLAGMVAAYTDYREGRLPREELPDIRDVHPDDEALLARMGFATEPGMNGEQILLQACAQCHNDRLDQTVSRARFNVDLRKMSREQKERAIARVMLPLENPGVMPPARFRRLSEDARRELIELLKR